MIPSSGDEVTRHSRAVLILAAILPAAILLLIAWLTFRMAATNPAPAPKPVPTLKDRNHR